jgi:hypothetical protein
MREVRRIALLEGSFAGMPERSVSEVMPERGSLGQVFVKAERARDNPCDLSNLKGMGKTRAVVVSDRREEDLSFVHQPPEGLRMDNPVAVALELGSHLRRHIRMFPPARIAGKKGIFRQSVLFPFEEKSAYVFHTESTSFQKANAADAAFPDIITLFHNIRKRMRFYFFIRANL